MPSRYDRGKSQEEPGGRGRARWRGVSSCRGTSGLALYADSISRAYYAAFHVARALLLSRGIEPKTHAGAVHQLNAEFIRPGLLSTSFNRLFAGLPRSREFPDYDAAVAFSKDDARAELEAARAFESAALELLRSEGWM